MPLNKKGKKIMKSMRKEYGSKKGEKVFYASRNKGTIKSVETEDFQQHEEVRGANSQAMKWLKARMDKKAEQDKKITAARSIRQGKKKMNDNKYMAYKDFAFRLDELIGAALATGALGAVAGLGVKKLLSKSAKQKALERAKARKEVHKKLGVDPGTNEGVLGATKGVARAAGLVPGVGIVGDVAAGGITAAQLAATKDKKKKSKLKKELAGDALAAVPGVGLATRGAQIAAKGAKVVRGSKAARKGGKLAKARGRAGAAIRKNAPAIGAAAEKAAVKKLRQKADEETTYKNEYVNKLVEAEREGKGHQFSKQKTKSGMKLKGFHDPRAMQAKKSSRENRSWKDPEGVSGKGVRRTITARSPATKYHGKGLFKK